MIELIIIFLLVFFSYGLLDYLIKECNKSTNVNIIYIQKVAIVCNILMCILLTGLLTVKIIEYIKPGIV